jgi:hypothetical protein
MKSNEMPRTTDKEKAQYAFIVIMEQIGGIAINIDALLCLGEAVDTVDPSFVSPRKK